MGEAKRRGTREQRVLEGIEKAEARLLARIEQERRDRQPLVVRRHKKTILTGLGLASLAMAAVALSGRVEGGQEVLEAFGRSQDEGMGGRERW